MTVWSWGDDKRITDAGIRAFHGTGGKLERGKRPGRESNAPGFQVSIQLPDRTITARKDHVNRESHEERMDAIARSNDEDSTRGKARATEQPPRPRLRIEGGFQPSRDDRTSPEIPQNMSRRRFCAC